MKASKRACSNARLRRSPGYINIGFTSSYLGFTRLITGHLYSTGWKLMKVKTISANGQISWGKYANIDSPRLCVPFSRSNEQNLRRPESYADPLIRAVFCRAGREGACGDW